MKKPAAKLPARRADLVLQAVGGELLVYDAGNHHAHALNRPAAFVLRHLDGRATAADLAQGLTRELGQPAGEQAVLAAVQELAAAGLLAAPVDASRRRVVRGLAAALVPAVASVLVPRPAAAASCLPLGSTCTTTSQCCTGVCSSVGSGISQCQTTGV